MSYRYSDNECMHSDALFFDAVHLKMNLMQGKMALALNMCGIIRV